MGPEEIRELTEDEVEEEIARCEKEIFRLNFRRAYQELENPSLLRQLRRDVARLKTIRRERELRTARTGGSGE